MSPIILIALFFLLTQKKSTTAPPIRPGYNPSGMSPGYAQNGGIISPGTAAAAGAFIKQFLPGPSSGTGFAPGYTPGVSPYAPGATTPGPWAPNYAGTPYVPGAPGAGPYNPDYYAGGGAATGSGDGLMTPTDAAYSADVSTSDYEYA